MDYHAALIKALHHETPQVKVAILKGLYDRGALDLDIRDNDGKNLLEGLCETEFLPVEVIEFVNSIAREDLYTLPRYGKWSLMDKQLSHDVSQSTHMISDQSKALAKMIERVDPKWWQAMDKPGSDEGSGLASILAKTSVAAAKPLAAVWERGVSPHARLRSPLKALAVRDISSPQALEAYIKAGGNLEERVVTNDKAPYSMWRLAFHRYQNLGPLLQEHATAGHINQEQLDQDNYFKKVFENSGSRVEMIKAIVSRPDWNTLSMYNGLPFWLGAIGKRADLIVDFLERKRKIPDFTQRDTNGRSVWFWVMRTGLIDEKTFEILDGRLPAKDFMKNNKGHGLFTQVLQELVDYKKTSWSHQASMTGRLSRVSPDLLFSGIDQIDLTAVYDVVDQRGFSPGELFLAMLQAPGAWASMTPVQRGHVFSGLLLNGEKLNYNLTNIWRDIRDKKFDALASAGLEWPAITDERLQVKTQQSRYSSGQDDRLMKIWMADRQKKHLSQELGIEDGEPRQAARKRF